MEDREDRGPRTIVTFKADPSLVESMKGLPNRSEFIRAAILSALDNLCPLCSGTGVLSSNQKRHWQKFSRNHTLEVCANCHEMRMVCSETEVQQTV